MVEYQDQSDSVSPLFPVEMFPVISRVFTPHTSMGEFSAAQETLKVHLFSAIAVWHALPKTY